MLSSAISIASFSSNRCRVGDKWLLDAMALSYQLQFQFVRISSGSTCIRRVIVSSFQFKIAVTYIENDEIKSSSGICQNSEARRPPYCYYSVQGITSILRKTRWAMGGLSKSHATYQKGAWSIKKSHDGVGMGGKALLISASYVICLSSLTVHVVYNSTKVYKWCTTARPIRGKFPPVPTRALRAVGSRERSIIKRVRSCQTTSCWPATVQ